VGIVPDAAVTQLAKLAYEWGHRHTHVSEADRIEPIVAANIDAVFHDTNVADYHDEITGWFRFTERSTMRCGNGSSRAQHPSELLGDDWYRYGDWGIEGADAGNDSKHEHPTEAREQS